MARPQELVSEALGAALLLAAVVGSGIMAERLAGGNVAIALLANSIATGAALVALILTFGPISGAHFNPAVSFANGLDGEQPWATVLAFGAVQIAGALAGVWIAHWMFGEATLQISSHARSGPSQLVSEFVATFGLIAVIRGCSRGQAWLTPFAVAAYITAAYWFTASTSFANPAVTIARSFTNTFAGIRPVDAPGFIAAQFAGSAAAAFLFRWMKPADTSIPQSTKGLASHAGN
jgi:glycerol uptake facilitator-like aquaporin